MKDTVYCVMITNGDDTNRDLFRKLSIKNFIEQTYQNKKLIIVNEGKKLDFNSEDILQVSIHNRKARKLTLGDLRNIALEMIPTDSIFTVWDDDDYRDPNYLKSLYAALKSDDFVFTTKRVEMNINNDFVWIMELKSGFVTFFGRKKFGMKYDSKDVNEDVNLKQSIIKHYRYKLLNNNPLMYIRRVHQNNTSILVSKDKNKIKDTTGNKVYFEHEASKYQIAKVREALNLSKVL